MRKSLYTLILLLISLAASAQEICNDGIDNDGDGFIDCFDGECSTDPSCEGSYVGNDATCEVTPSEFPDFTMTMDVSVYSFTSVVQRAEKLMTNGGSCLTLTYLGAERVMPH